MVSMNTGVMLSMLILPLSTSSWNLAVSERFHLAVRSDAPVTLGILCDVRCSGGIDHLHGKRDCCVRVSLTCATKNR